MDNITRFHPEITKGLNNEEINKRLIDGLNYKGQDIKTKSNAQIIANNIFTLFNALNFGLATTILFFGELKNILFIGTVLMNIIISSYQELKAKHIVDKLSLINETKTNVIRNGKQEQIAHENIVLDDIIILRIGDQLVVDSIILDGDVTVNESFITGEEKPIKKSIGDMILSGSFIISGVCHAKAEHIADDNYTNKISNGAKYIKEINSELMFSLKKIIKVLSFIILPLGVLLFITQMGIDDNNINMAVLNTCAALIGMIPDGLVLLTSTVLAISLIRLGQFKVLIQELYAIETLARVDVLCLDKTGTITEGAMEVDKLICEADTKENEIKTIINNLCCTLDDISPTMKAIKDKFQNSDGIKYKAKNINLFSSETKYSSVELEDITYFLGAPDFIIKNNKNKYQKYEKDYRVILLAKEVKNRRTPLGIILIQDKIRASAKDTLKYFKKQGVTIKIISGDNPVTVSQIAKKVGVNDYDKYIDFSNINTEEEMKKAYLENTIFGRVKPEQKKDLILLIKRLGHTVGMTGDGVNDVLALKEADCSIAMASGSDAARNVSQVVLLDSNFDAMPKVVEEGRQTINNISRSASLFLTKTIYTILITITLLFLSYNYPFQPIHLSMMNLITIGIPAFVLALEPNKNRVIGTFISKVIPNALPTALTTFTTVILMMVLGDYLQLEPETISTMAVMLSTIIMFTLLYKLSVPFNFIKKLLFGGVIAIFIIELMFLRDFFSLTTLTSSSLVLVIVMFLATFTILRIFNFILKYTVNLYSLIKNKYKQ